jgi:phenylalanyl-tRNA synthetase beta chain
MMVTSLADRGGKIFTTKVQYPYKQLKDVVTPKLEVNKMRVDLAYINEVLGFKLTSRETAELLEKARYGVGQLTKGSVLVEIPCYRIDIMHPIDIVEDIAIAYGYNKIEPRWQRLPTTGALASPTVFYDLVREVMVGLGFQEILTFTLTNKETLGRRMNKKLERVVEIANPRMATYTCLRNWLLPSLMEFLSHNAHVEYPQKIFEVGYVIVHDDKAETRTKNLAKLACVTTHPNANFTEIKSYIEALFLNLGLKNWIVRETRHPSFIEGRTASVRCGKAEIGVMGEIHPQVLNNFELKNPASAFEISLEELMKGL